MGRAATRIRDRGDPADDARARSARQVVGRGAPLRGVAGRAGGGRAARRDDREEDGRQPVLRPPLPRTPPRGGAARLRPTDGPLVLGHRSRRGRRGDGERRRSAREKHQRCSPRASRTFSRPRHAWETSSGSASSPAFAARRSTRSRPRCGDRARRTDRTGAVGPAFSWAGELPIELGDGERPRVPVRPRPHPGSHPIESLGDAAQRKTRHLQIGRWLLANVPTNALEDAICSIVDHLDRAVDRLAQDERGHVAHLNQRAGCVARALGSARVGPPLLLRRARAPPAGTVDHGSATSSGSRSCGTRPRCAALTGDHARASGWSKAPCARTDVALEKAELGQVLAQSSALQGAHREAIRRGREGLRVLGVELPPPQDVTGAAARAERERTRETLRGRFGPSSSSSAGRWRTRRSAHGCGFYVGLAAATWFTAPELFRDRRRPRAVALDGASRRRAGLALRVRRVRDRARDGRRVRGGRTASAGSRWGSRNARPILPRRAGRSWCSVDTSAPGARHSGTAYRSFAGRTRAGSSRASWSTPLTPWRTCVFALWFRGATLDSVLTETDAALAFYRQDRPPGRDRVRRAVHARRAMPERPDARLRALRRRRVRRSRIPARDGRERARTGRLPRRSGCRPATCSASLRSRSRTRGRESAGCRTSGRSSSRRTTTSTRRSRCRRCTTARRRRSKTRSSRSCAGTRPARGWARQSPATFGHKRDLVAAEIARLERAPRRPIELYERAIASARREGCGARGSARARAVRPVSSTRAGTTKPPRRTSAARWRATPHGELSRR